MLPQHDLFLVSALSFALFDKKTTLNQIAITDLAQSLPHLDSMTSESNSSATMSMLKSSQIKVAFRTQN